jgi:hypothetical protein
MMAKLLAVLSYVDERMGEASTWSSLSAMLLALHVNVDPGLWHAITLWGSLGSAGLGFLIKEASSGKTPSQMGQDILDALVALTNKPNRPPPVA